MAGRTRLLLLLTTLRDRSEELLHLGQLLGCGLCAGCPGNRLGPVDCN